MECSQVYLKFASTNLATCRKVEKLVNTGKKHFLTEKLQNTTTLDNLVLLLTAETWKEIFH